MTTNTTVLSSTSPSANRLRHPRIVDATEDFRLMLAAGDSASLLLGCGPSGVGKTTRVLPRRSRAEGAGIPSRQLDWESIRAKLQEILKLPEPITLGEACQRVGVEYNQLYLRANKEAREIADRYRLNRQAVKIERETKLRGQLGEILDERLMAGYGGMSARDIRNLIGEDSKSVRSITWPSGLLMLNGALSA